MAAAESTDGEQQTKTLWQSMHILRAGPFRRYMLGEALSTTGTWMQLMADSWIMTSLTSSAVMLALTNVASSVPVLLLTMLGGSTADRFDKRTILLITQVAQIILASTMGYLVITNQIQIWMVICVAGLLGVVNAFEMPAASALVPELVAPEEIGDAMAVDRSSFHTTRLIGPALAGLVIGAWGAAIAYFANALSFIGLMIALRSLPRRIEGTAEEEEARSSGFKDGLRYIRGDAPTFAMMLMMGLMTLVPSPLLMVLMPLYARTHFHLGARGMGMMMSINAAGSLVGSIWLLTIRPEDRVGRIGMVSVGVAVGLFLLGIITYVPFAAAALFLMSLCLASTFGLVNTIIQQRAPGHLRGRISATTGMIFFGCQPFSALLVSRFADVVGLPRAFMVAGPVYLVGAALVLLGPGRKAAPPPALEPLAPEAVPASMTP